jgi:hypothetical protein
MDTSLPQAPPTTSVSERFRLELCYQSVIIVLVHKSNNNKVSVLYRPTVLNLH